MKLSELFKGTKIIYTVPQEDISEIEISGIAINSVKVKKDYLFVAIPGFKKDGHDFIPEAINNGACAIMLQKDIHLPEGIARIMVKDSRKELALVCANFYRAPSSGIILTGVTGTNGKTTSVFLLDSIFGAAGIKTAYITTVSAQIAGRQLSFDRTTPDSLELNEFFANCISEGVEAAAMEVSSHSIDLHRVDWLDFDYFLFTNLTQDHLDYHETMENYFSVKNRLFTGKEKDIFGGKGAAINIDDIYGREIASATALEKITFGIDNPQATLRATDIVSSIEGIDMTVNLKNSNSPNGTWSIKEGRLHVKSLLCGYFNVYNILGTLGISIMAGIEIPAILNGISRMPGVPGRFEKINTGRKANVIVDYAHTPDCLENVLFTAHSLLPEGGRLISVFGCGGDRDRKKRKIMGSVSSEIADFTIITSDNPRTEDPVSIINMIEEGFTSRGNCSYKKITDRKEAIITALEMAGKKDIVLIAGKGHENYQEFADRKIHFSDQEIVRDWGKA